MDNIKFNYNNMARMLWGAFFGILIVGIIIMLCSCTKTEYVTVEKIKHDTTYVSKVQRDSVRLHDSIYVHEWTKGDTVYRDRDRWHTVYRETKSCDIIYQHRVDSLPVPYPVIKEVEKQPTRRQQMVMCIGLFAIIAAACWFVWWAMKVLRRFGIFRI